MADWWVGDQRQLDDDRWATLIVWAGGQSKWVFSPPGLAPSLLTLELLAGYADSAPPPPRRSRLDS